MVNVREQELEEKLYNAIKSKAEINDLSEKLQDKYSKQVKAFDRERKRWNQDSLRNNTEIQKLRTHGLQVINENTNLTSQLTGSQISHAKYKAENDIKSKKIRSLEFMIKILESKSAKQDTLCLSSAQKDVLLIQNDSSKANQLEYLKSKAISKPIVGGDDEKNITKSDDISAVIESSHIVTAPSNNSISKYFIRKKSMDQAEKINNIISDHTDDKNTSIPEESVIGGYVLSPRVDTDIIPKVSNEIDISKANNIVQEIPKMTPYLAHRENNSGASTKELLLRNISPLLAYIFLTLLIIAIIWFIRRIWGLNKKSNQFQMHRLNKNREIP